MKTYVQNIYDTFRRIILGMRNVSGKIVEKIKTHINFFFRIRDFYEIMWKNIFRVGQDTDDNIIRRMRFA